MVRESICDETEKEILDGTLALVYQLLSTDGLWVASTKCNPAALAFCANLQIASSTSPSATYHQIS